VASALSDFAARYPKIDIELTASDRIIDLIAENADVGIRTGVVRDTSLMVRKIAEIHRHVYASPEYLARRGTPRAPSDLAEHDCIVITSIAAGHRWLFAEEGRVRAIDLVRRLTVDSSESALQLAQAGAGVVRLGDIVAAEAVRCGRLVQLFADSHVVEPVQLSAVYPSGRQAMPKVRAFNDFLVERFRHAPWRHAGSAEQAGRSSA
jgi:DNA-binding transcriptional LysR family regulator